MFFKKRPSNIVQLVELVPKVTDTGYLFWNINDDLGKAAEQLAKDTPLILMSYAYARRVAMAAMYLQGLVTKDMYDHVVSIFKAVQQKTGHTVEFQEKAGAKSVEFMQSYHYLINGQFVKKTIAIAQGYEVPSRRMSDGELFAAVTDTVFEEQERARCQ